MGVTPVGRYSVSWRGPSSAADDDFIYGFCRALDTRKANVAWQKPEPLPLADMCRDTEEGPLRVPLHPAAERFWRERGYMR